MEQFSLEKYLANPSRKVVTRDGRNARIVSTDRRYENYPIVALVQICDNYLNEEVYTYTENGEFEAEKSTKWDLFFAPEKHEEQITVERFNPNTLKPYDKVLVRDCNSGNWSCDLFSHIEEKKTYPYYCVGNYHRWCIPYNEETKHLLGTSNDCPEYYKWWEEEL